MVRLVKSRPRKNQSERLVLTQDYAYMQIRQFISALSAEKCLSVNLVTSVLGPFDLASFADVPINRHALFQDCVTNAGNVCPVTCLHGDQAFFFIFQNMTIFAKYHSPVGTQLVVPSPTYPFLQEQLYDPTVFVHVAVPPRH